MCLTVRKCRSKLTLLDLKSKDGMGAHKVWDGWSQQGTFLKTFVFVSDHVEGSASEFSRRTEGSKFLIAIVVLAFVMRCQLAGR